MGEDERLLTLAGAMKACIDGHTCTTTFMGESLLISLDEFMDLQDTERGE